MHPTLVFDADDTLWDEQGVLQQFEAAVAAFIEQRTGAASPFRRRFIAAEERNIPHLGYGFASYLFSVAETLAEEPLWNAHRAELLALVADLMRALQQSPPQVIEGVRPTLRKLAERDYRLVVLTRGVGWEQRDKLERSGLHEYFAEVRTVPSKDVAIYRRAARDLGDARGRSLCMIGNSLRSDIAPALAAGWCAIHVPAPTQWSHDHGGLPRHARFRRAGRFEEVPELLQSETFWG